MSGELLPLPQGSSADPLGLFVGSLSIPQQHGVFPVTQDNVDSAVAIALQQLPKQPLLAPTSIQTAAYPGPQMNDLVRLDASLGPITQLMPRALGAGSFAVKKTDATTNPITVTATGTDTVDGLYTLTLRLPGEVKTFISIPGGWVTANGMNTVAATDLRYPRTINGNAPNPATGDITVPIAGSASVSVQGLVKLAGDLGGSADFPTVPALSSKADLVGGMIVSSQIPSLALTTSVPVANQAAMLALTATQVQPGDLALRADGAGTFMLMAADPSILSNWTLLPAPADVVSSVNGQVGAVVLSAANIGAASVSSVNTEVARAGAAEGTITSNLSAEVTRATAAENTKASSTALNAETTRATNAEGTLTNNVSTVTGNLANEISRAQGVEATNATAITTEKNRALAAEAALTAAAGGGIPRVGPLVGSYVLPYLQPASSNTFSPILGAMYFAPFVFPSSITVDTITVSYSGSGGTVRFSYWKPDTATGLPYTLISEAGTTSGTTTPSTPVVLPAGLIWVGMALQSGSCAIYSASSSFFQMFSSAPNLTANSASYLTTTETTYTGAMPATLYSLPIPGTQGSPRNPTMALHRSA